MHNLHLLFICFVVGPIDGLPTLPALPELPKLPTLEGIQTGLSLVTGHKLQVPSLESSGCNVSSVPTVGNFTASSLVGHWYQHYYSGVEFLEDFYKDIMTVTNIRYTVTGDLWFPDVLTFYRCSRNSYLGGFYTHTVCPSNSFKMTVSNGVLRTEPLDIIRTMMPNTPLDKTQVRLIAVDEEFIALYSCLLPLLDGTCAKIGLLLDIHSRKKELSVAAVERLKVVADSTCIKFEKLKKIEQNFDFPFYIPEGDSA